MLAPVYCTVHLSVNMRPTQLIRRIGQSSKYLFFCGCVCYTGLQLYIFFLSCLSFASVDPAAMAYVQKESSVLAASFTRDQCRTSTETTGKSQEEETQITENYPCLVNTSFYITNTWTIVSQFTFK